MDRKVFNIVIVLALFIFFSLLTLIFKPEESEKSKHRIVLNTEMVKRIYTSLNDFYSKESTKTDYQYDELEIIKKQIDSVFSVIEYSRINGTEKNQYISFFKKLRSDIDSTMCYKKIEKEVVDWYSGEVLRTTISNEKGKFSEISYLKPKEFIVQKKYKRAKKLYDKYGWDKEVCYTISQGKIQVGMNKEMVKIAWGSPKDINRTTNKYGTHEQWCYSSGNYVYFDDDELTSIQN